MFPISGSYILYLRLLYILNMRWRCARIGAADQTYIRTHYYVYMYLYVYCIIIFFICLYKGRNARASAQAMTIIITIVCNNICDGCEWWGLPDRDIYACTAVGVVDRGRAGYVERYCYYYFAYFSRKTNLISTCALWAAADAAYMRLQNTNVLVYYRYMYVFDTNIYIYIYMNSTL